jgi:lysophospholipase L1-like esterase
MKFFILLFLVFNFKCFSSDLKIGIIGDSNSVNDWCPPRINYHYLISKKFNAEIINDSLCGRATRDLLECSQKMLSEHSDLDLIIIALGFCDGIYHLNTNDILNNYDNSIKLIKSFNIPILLNRVDISGYAWHEKCYHKDFVKIFDDIKILHPEVILYNSITYETSTDQSYFSGGTDSVHPNSKGHKEIADRIENILINKLSLNNSY